MPEITRSVLVGHTPAQMFALIDAVEEYPEFLPWCGAARVIFRDETTTRAALVINYHGIRQSFTTDNTKRAPEQMLIRLVEGPFRKLEGVWRFTALGDRGCKIEFHLSYEFSGKLLETLIGPVFNYIAGTMVEEFVRRAASIYG
jgi:ribosome-associated toxin RatA of RatAB toxin-antitoxin module